MRASISICLLLWAFSSWGETEDPPKQRAESVVITVSAQELALSAVSASVTIISREMIEASKAERVVDLLREIPFVHISQVGGAGGLTAVTLRGGDPNFTLVLIDGVPVNDPTNLLGGSYDFSFLSTDQIERIEIVRGPLSSIYGSEAISGVINIISRSGTGAPRVALEGRAGSFGSQEFRAGIEGRRANWSYGLSASYQDVDEQTVSDFMNRKSVSGSTVLDFAIDKSLNATARYTEGDSSGFPENGGGPLYSIGRDPETAQSRESVLGIRYSQPQFGLQLDYFEHRNDSFTPEILDSIPPGPLYLPSFANQSDFDRTRFQWTGLWKRGGLSASVLASWKREDGDSVGVIADVIPSEFHLRRDTVSGGGELLYDSKNIHATFGIRFDNSEDFTTETSPRFGATWSLPGSQTRLRGTWGEGYKLPSFFALADPSIGNPELLPERSRGWDVGMEQEFLESRAFFSATWFHNSFQDLIDFSPELFRLVNRREVITQGLELEGKFQAHQDLQLSAHLSYVNADIHDSSEPLRDRPEWRGGIGLDWQMVKKGRLYLRYTSVGDRFDFQVPVPNLSIAESYQVLDAAFSYEMAKGFTTFVRADNLLDRKYQEFIGFPNPGIFVRAGISVSFEP